ncbi:MAG: polysaccharide deacetylase family protein [Deltaproteobacteria bacterium]|nr:polysaccharide deacetylase family protein [Deltaproteobacteria bacterium]
MSDETFDAHLRTLQASFEMVGETDVLAWLAGERTFGPRTCWLTFDDGYIDLVERVAPALADAGAQPTAFVATDVLTCGRVLPADRWYAVLGAARRRRGVLVGFGEEWAFDLDREADYARLIDGPEKRRYLAAPEAVRPELLEHLARAVASAVCTASERLYLEPRDLPGLVEAGWSVGSHTASHPLLTTLHQDAIDRELLRSREDLARLGVMARTLAYPDGAWSPAVAARAAACGYDAAVTLQPSEVKATRNALALPRLLPVDDPLWVERELVAWHGHGPGCSITRTHTSS